MVIRRELPSRGAWRTKLKPRKIYGIVLLDFWLYPTRLWVTPSVILDPIYWIWVIVPLRHTTEYIQLFEKDKTCFTIFHPGCVLEGGATLTVGSSDVYSAPLVASAINLYSSNTHLTESQIFNQSRVLFLANMAKIAIYRTQQCCHAQWGLVKMWLVWASISN